MAQKKNIRRPIRLRRRKSSLLVKTALIAVLVVCVAAVFVLQAALADTREQTTGLRAQAAALEQENDRLQKDIRDLGTVEGIIRLAREKLGLTVPNTVVIVPEN